MAKAWVERFPRPECSHPAVTLIALPGAGNSPHVFANLALALPFEFDLVAIHYQSRGRRHAEPMAEDMHTLVNQIFDSLKDTFLNFPYALIGHSFGANVAVEFASHIEAIGARAPVAMFLMSSTPAKYFGLEDLPTPVTLDAVVKWANEKGLTEDGDATDTKTFEPLRGDLAICKGYAASDPKPQITVPVVSIGAKDDVVVPPEQLPWWREWMQSNKEAIVHCDFEGGHNFHTIPAPGLAETIASELHAHLKSHPMSRVVGPVVGERYPETTVHALFLESASKHGDRCAIVGPNAQESLTYAELQRRVLLLAKKLCGLGVGADQIVGVYMERSTEFVMGSLAALCAEGAFAQLELVTPPQTLRAIIDKYRPIVILTKHKYLKKLEESTQKDYQVVCIDNWNEVEQSLCTADEAAYEARQRATPDSLFKIPTSSGSTGIPKAIGQVHRSAVCSYYWRMQNIPYADNEQEACNVFFIWEMLRPLLGGRTLQVMSETCILEPEEFVDFVVSRGITRMLLTPSVAETLIDGITEPSFPSARREALAKSAWRTIVFCGEVVSSVLQAKWNALMPEMGIANLYSIAEVYDVNCNLPDPESTAASKTRKFMTCGPVLDGVQVSICRNKSDNELEELPFGAVGDVYVTGPCQARGYLGDPEKTAAVFFPNTLERGSVDRDAIIYKTGDVGRFIIGPSGSSELEIWGRVDSVIKLRGYSVEKAAIEEVFMAFPGPPKIEWVTVLRDNDPVTGRTERIIAAAILVKDGNELSTQESEIVLALKAWAKKRLPAYAVPSIVLVDEIPVSAYSMKGDMNLLLKLCREKLEQAIESQPQVQQKSPSAAFAGLGPLVDAWTSVLQMPPQDVDTNFFEAGGHSLLAMKFVRAIKDKLPDAQISIVDLFDNPTINDLGRYLGLVQTKACVPDRPLETVPTIPHDRYGGRPEPIALLGMSCQFCGLKNYNEFWQCLLNGDEAIRRLPKNELRNRGFPEEVLEHPDFVVAGGPMEDDDKFDHAFWQISPHEARLMDPQQRLFLQAAYGALEDAGRSRREARPERTGVFAASWFSGYLISAMRGGAIADPTLSPEDAHLTELGNNPEYLASRLAYLLDLRGMAMAVQTSCSSSLAAVITGSIMLHTRQVEMAISGACSVTVPAGGYLISEGTPLSISGKVQSFSANADGTVFTDGVGVGVFRLLSQVEDRDRVWSSICGYGMNQDGAARGGFSAPSKTGQARALKLCLEHAGLAAEDVGYLECHSTGTVVGDPIEVAGIAAAYGGKSKQPILGCVKPNIGHANLASGMAGLVKVSLSLHHTWIPRTLFDGKLNPMIEASIVSEARSFPMPANGEVRRAGVSSFGIGGTNASIIMQEAPEQDAVTPVCEVEAESTSFLPLTAKTESSLKRMAATLATYLDKSTAFQFTDVCRSIASREEFQYRLGISASDNAEAIEKLRAFVDDGEAPVKVAGSPAVVLLFSGNGSYYKGLGHGLAAKNSTFRKHFEEARAACGFSNSLDYGAEPLGAAREQVELFCVQYALAKYLETSGNIRADAAMGHSVGLFAALVASGSMDLSTAAKLLTERGKFCEEMAEGAMLSVAGLPRSEVEDVITQCGFTGCGAPQIAVVNAPTLLVVSGSMTNLKLLEEKFQGQSGVRCRFLQVSRAYHHAEMMNGAAAKFECFVETFTTRPNGLGAKPNFPVSCNVTGGWVSDDVPSSEYFGKHIRQPVLFSDNLESLAQIAPGRPLILLELGGIALKQIVEANIRAAQSSGAPLLGGRRIDVLTLSRHPKDDTDEARVLAGSLASAWQAGLPLDVAAMCGGCKPLPQWLPTYSFEPTRHWVQKGVGEATVQPHNVLVRFREASATAGVAVYAFPYAGGSSATYHSWAKHAPEDVDFVAVEMPKRGVRAGEDWPSETSYDSEIKKLASAIENDFKASKSSRLVILGLSSGSVHATNACLVLQNRISIDMLIVAGRAPPQPAAVPGSHNLCNMDEWVLVDEKIRSSVEWQRDQAPILALDLKLDLQGSDWGGTQKIVQAPLRVFCGASDNNFLPAAAYDWAACAKDESTLEVTLLRGGHEFLLTSSFKDKVFSKLPGDVAVAKKTTTNVNSKPVEPAGGVSKMKINQLCDWLHTPSWTELPSVENSCLAQNCRVAVIQDATSFLPDVPTFAESMSSTKPITLIASNANVGASLGDAFQSPGLTSLRVIYLCTKGAKESFTPVLNLMRDLRSYGSSHQPVIFTIVVEASAASLAGLALVATQESPELLCRIVQIPQAKGLESCKSLSQRVVQEALLDITKVDSLEPVMALKQCNGEWVRFAQSYTPLKLPVRCFSTLGMKLGMQIKKGQTFLVTGGFGRIGRVLAEHLVSHWDANVILTTRGSLNDDRSNFVKHLEKYGRSVRTVSGVSLNSVDEWSSILNSVSVDGVFHLAGMADLKYIDEMEEKHVIAEYDPKELSVKLLDDAIASLASRGNTSPPSFVMLFSSMAAILGGFGMSAYSAANRTMDNFVLDKSLTEQNSGAATRWVSVNWDDWAFEYDKEQTEAYTDKMAQLAMSPDEGLAILQTIVATLQLQPDEGAGTPMPRQILVSTTALGPRLEEWIQQRSRLTSLRSLPAAAKLGASKNAVKHGSLAADIAAVFQNVLGMDKAPQTDEQFFDLGGDSITVAPVLRAIKEICPKKDGKKPLSIPDIFTLQSPAKLAKFLEAH